MREFVPAWANRRAEAAEVISRCSRVIQRRTHKAFVFGLHVDHFHAVNTEFRLLEEYGTELSCVAGICVWELDKWMRRKPGGHRVNHDHEKGEKGWNRAVEALAAGGITLRFRESTTNGRVFAPFQGTDMLAWIYRRVILDKQVGKEGGRYLEWFHSVRKLLPQSALAFTESGLREMCRAHPEVFPRRVLPR